MHAHQTHRHDAHRDTDQNTSSISQSIRFSLMRWSTEREKRMGEREGGMKEEGRQAGREGGRERREGGRQGGKQGKGGYRVAEHMPEDVFDAFLWRDDQPLPQQPLHASTFHVGPSRHHTVFFFGFDTPPSERSLPSERTCLHVGPGRLTMRVSLQ